jgi:hypothetical protein
MRVEIDATFEYGPGEAQRSFGRDPGRIWSVLVFALGVLSLSIAAVSGSKGSAQGLLALDGLVFCWAGIQISRARQATLQRRLRQMAGERNLRIGADGLASTTGMGSRTVGWSAIQRVRRSAGWWWFHSADGAAVFGFPERVLTSDQNGQLVVLLVDRGLITETPSIP